MCNAIKSVLKCGIQLILTIVNFLVLVSGIGLLVVGSVFLYKAKTYDPDGEEGVEKEAAAIIALGTITALGALLTIIGFCGCCGALCNNSAMLKTYAAIQLFIFLGVLTCLIFVAVAWNEKFTNEWERQVREEYSKPGPDGQVTSLTLSWDARMLHFQCCGADSYTDWRGSYYTTQSGEPVPETCCKVDGNGNYTSLVQCRAEAMKPDLDYGVHLNTKGCNYVVENFEIALYVISSFLLVFQLASVILACCIIKNKSKTDAASA